MKRKKVAAFVMAADMCMEENAAEACMEVSEQTENSEGVTENDGKVASDGLADNAGENQWESPAEGSSQGQPESDGNKYGHEQLLWKILMWLSVTYQIKQYFLMWQQMYSVRIHLLRQ